MLSTLFPDWVSEFVGKVEQALATGLIIGPIIGTLLMKWGDFYLPFFTLSGVYIVFFFCGLFFLPG